MISGIMELRMANKAFDAVKQELRDEGQVSDEAAVGQWSKFPARL